MPLNQWLAGLARLVRKKPACRVNRPEMLLTAVLLAATLNSCSAQTTIENADSLFANSDAAIARHDVSAAKTAYDTGIQLLADTPWFLDDKSCDPPRYTLQRYVTVLHSLNVAVQAGLMTAMDAHVREQQMGTELFRALPANFGERYWRAFPDLAQRQWKYIEKLDLAARSDDIAAHNPNGPGCAYPNLDAEVLQQAQPEYPSAARGMDIGEVSVKAKVSLALDGSISAVAITQSSGVMPLDQAALAAARVSSYLPAVKECKRVPGTFEFTVTFDPNG